MNFNSDPGGFVNTPKSTFSDSAVRGAFLGCIMAGGINGALSSTQDEVIEPFSEYAISGLSVYVKYPGAEPPVLEKIDNR